MEKTKSLKVTSQNNCNNPKKTTDEVLIDFIRHHSKQGHLIVQLAQDQFAVEIDGCLVVINEFWDLTIWNFFKDI